MSRATKENILATLLVVLTMWGCAELISTRGFNDGYPEDLDRVERCCGERDHGSDVGRLAGSVK